MKDIIIPKSNKQTKQDKIVLPTEANLNHQECTMALASTIDRVNKGETVSVAVVELGQDGSAMHYWAGSSGNSHMIVIGALTRLISRIGSDLDDIFLENE